MTILCVMVVDKGDGVFRPLTDERVIQNAAQIIVLPCLRGIEKVVMQRHIEQ